MCARDRMRQIEKWSDRKVVFVVQVVFSHHMPIFFHERPREIHGHTTLFGKKVRDYLVMTGKCATFVHQKVS